MLVRRDEGIDAAELLEEADSTSDGKTAPFLAVKKIQPEQSLQLQAAHPGVLGFLHQLLKLVLGDNGLVFSLDSLIGCGQASQSAETGQGFRGPVDQGEPTRGVREEVNAESQKRGADHLQPEGESE